MISKRLLLVLVSGYIWIRRLFADIAGLLLIVDCAILRGSNLWHLRAPVIHYNLAGIIIDYLVILLLLYLLVILSLLGCRVGFA